MSRSLSLSGNSRALNPVPDARNRDSNASMWSRLAYEFEQGYDASTKPEKPLASHYHPG
jgi:hypothetical protein